MKLFTNSYIDHYGFVNTFKDQNYIISYLHPKNPYRSLIICYEVGLGKTYASACLAHIYLTEGYKVLYLSNSLNSINNFKVEYNKVILDSRFKSLEKNINLMTFTKFYRLKEIGNYGLVILDEAHNLRENAIRYKIVKDKLDLMINSKLLIISATPMIDSVDELDSILNLASEKTKIIFSSNKMDNNLKINYIGELIIENNDTERLFLSKMKGLQLEDYRKALKSDNDTVYTNTRQASISYNNNFNPKISLDEQSSKVDKLIETLEDGKLTLIFCFYVARGINFVAKALENIGYSKWNTLSTTKNYAIIDGKTTAKESEEILNTFNSIANTNGKHIQVLIGSSVLSESVTLYRVRKLHILSPFWNYGQIEQSIGRAIRIGSHDGLIDKTIDIYLHASYSDFKDGKYIGKDIDMWNIANEKKIKINKRLNQEKEANDLIKSEWEDKFDVPIPDGKLIIKYNEWIWDLSKCFDHNKFKISWCKIYLDNAIGYNTKEKLKIIGNPPSYIKINKPLEDGYTIWRSCIDDKLRISYIDKSVNKFTKRGRLLTNVNTEKLSKELFCKSSISDIIDTLKKNNRYFDKQIEYDLQ